MLQAGEVIAFAASADLGRARAFYEQVLGLRLTEQNDFACVFDANGTRQQGTLARGVVAAGKRVPDLERGGELGVRPLHRCPGGVGERLDRLREALPHLVVEADVPEVGRGRHAQVRELARLAHGRHVVVAERRERARIEQVGARQRGERQSALADRPRERAEVRQQQPPVSVVRAGDETVGRLEPHRAAERGGNPYRAAAVGAERHLADAERQRTGSTAGAASGRAVGCKGIAGLAVELVARRAAVTELGHVGAPDGDRSRLLEPDHAGRALLWIEARQRARAGSARVPRLPHRLLDRERPARQRTGVFTAFQPRLELPRPHARGLGVDEAERVDERVDLCRALERRLDARQRRGTCGHPQPRSTRLPGTMSSRPSGQRTQAL